MKRFTNWLKSLSSKEKTMLIFIILLVVCIITRWGYISSQLGESVKSRFTLQNKTEAIGEDTVRNVGIDSIPNTNNL